MRREAAEHPGRGRVSTVRTMPFFGAQTSNGSARIERADGGVETGVGGGQEVHDGLNLGNGLRFRFRPELCGARFCTVEDAA